MLLYKKRWHFSAPPLTRLFKYYLLTFLYQFKYNSILTLFYLCEINSWMVTVSKLQSTVGRHIAAAFDNPTQYVNHGDLYLFIACAV